MKKSDAFPSRFLKACDLAHPVSVIIASVQMEEVGFPKQTLPVVSFHGKEKALVLNSTNWDLIENAYGDDSDIWLGKTIVIFPTTAEFQGKLTPCLRVRVDAGAAAVPTPAAAPAPPAPAPAPASDYRPDDDIPF